MRQVILVGVFCLFLSGAADASVATDATLPQVTPDTTRVAPTGTVRTIPGTCPATAAGLQSCINSASSNSAGTTCDAVEIAAGTVITSVHNLNLPNGPSRTCYIEIRSTKHSSLPEGKRVGPADAGNLATLELSDVGPYKGVYGSSNAHHYRLIGLEIRPNSSETDEMFCAVCPWYDVNGNAFSNIANIQDHWIIDRSWIHGNGRPARHAVTLTGNHMSVIDSTIENITTQTGFGEAHALFFSHAGSGYLVQNSKLEADGEVVIFGGGGGNPGGDDVRDVTFRRNLITKRRSWNPKDPSYSGTTSNSKNLVEFKAGYRILFDGNILENSFMIDDQKAQVFNINTADSQYDPGIKTQDITIRNNWMRHANFLFDLQSGYCEDPPGNTCKNSLERITIRNNLATDVSCASLWRNIAACYGVGLNQWAGDPEHFVDDLKIEHNTFFNADGILAKGDSTNSALNLTFRSNVVYAADYGFNNGATGHFGATALNEIDRGSSTWVVSYNVFVLGGGGSGVVPSGSNNQNAASTAAVGFADTTYAFSTSTTGDNLSDVGKYRLSSSSPYRNDAHDGTDPGVNIDALLAALGGSGDTVAPSAPPNLRTP